MLFPTHWSEYFFYPLQSSRCSLCGYPTEDRATCQYCKQHRRHPGIGASAFLSYTWGHSRSPAYAFKVRKNFDEGLRRTIAKLFALLVWAKFGPSSGEAVVIGVPPRRSIQWGMRDHLDSLLCAVEEVNFQVLRDVLAFHGAQNNEQLIIADSNALHLIRGRPVIIIDNLWNTGKTALAVALKLLENGATEVNLCMMSRWITNDTYAIRCAKEYRATTCEDRTNLYWWYRDVYCRPTL